MPIRLIVAVLAFCVPLVASARAQATLPGANGKIVFTSWDELYTVGHDGSGVAQVLRPDEDETLDWYPAYVDTVPGKVRGEVWRIHQPSVVQHLNGYEGGDYLRELVRCVLENGRKVTAWTYKYRLPLRGVPRIDSGDYLEWVKGAAKAPA